MIFELIIEKVNYYLGLLNFGLLTDYEIESIKEFGYENHSSPPNINCIAVGIIQELIFERRITCESNEIKKLKKIVEENKCTGLDDLRSSNSGTIWSIGI